MSPRSEKEGKRHEQTFPRSRKRYSSPLLDDSHQLFPTIMIADHLSDLYVDKGPSEMCN